MYVCSFVRLWVRYASLTCFGAHETGLCRLREFDADMIFISAGFDAHRKDEINCGYISLIEEDYAWISLQLARLETTCCEGRLVSVLAGGYNLTGGIVSPFARSVKSHVSLLNAENNIHEQ